MSYEITTTDFSKFGYRERVIVEELLRVWREQGLPEDFWGEEVSIMMNMNSGYVFLTNSEYQVAMMNGDKLESWYTCTNCGHEGFAEDMEHNLDDPDCRDYLLNVGVISEDDQEGGELYEYSYSTIE
ncbi:MAG: hypothetical protein DKM50_13355 [Candidatus Margulisiibacteriota bacterium]|nr:MAG: hypothetical protein DKM50_13355 [Candidatus Margulisiibacteriota bacterium]